LPSGFPKARQKREIEALADAAMIGRSDHKQLEDIVTKPHAAEFFQTTRLASAVVEAM
jgi:hypothetical protein